GYEEHRIADGEAKLLANPFTALDADILRERPRAALLALAPEDVAKPRLTFALRPGIHAVAEGAIAALGRRYRPHLDGRIGRTHAGETLEAGAAEVGGHVLHPDGVAKVWLVGPVAAYRLRIGNPRKLLRHRLCVRKLLEHPTQHRLDRREHVFLGDEAH